jgi:hypothetical protein
MQRSLNQISAIATIVGSILFLVAAFLPISFRVFPQTSPAKKLESINADPGQWFAAQVLFAFGTLVTVIGIALFAYNARHESFRWLIWASVTLLAVGALPWLWQLYARTVDPAGFTEGSFPMWPYLFYFFTTEVGLAVYGVALLSSPLPTWAGWVVMVSMVLLALLTIILRDMAPFAFYVITLFAGVMLFRQG